MLLMITVALVTLAALNAILTAWATVLDARHASALMPALGANSRQVNAPSTGAVRAGWAPGYRIFRAGRIFRDLGDC